MTHQRHDHDLEADLQKLFDRTSSEAGDAALQRMMSRAAEIPTRRSSFRRRITHWLPQPAWVALPVAVVLLLVAGRHAVTTPGVPSPVPAAMLSSGASTGAPDADAAFAAEDGLVPADPLAVLDGDADDAGDDFALLDPPHMAFDNVDDAVWLAVYEDVIEDRISL